MTDTTAGEGVTRGQIAYEGWAQGLPGCEWSNQTATQKRAWEKAAEALAAQPSAGAQREAWSKVRTLFMSQAERFVAATRYEEASIIADNAARDIVGICATPAQPAVRPGPMEDLGDGHWVDVEPTQPAQPDTGDVAALREAKNIIDTYFMDDDYDANGALRKVSAVLDAALSKPNAP